MILKCEIPLCPTPDDWKLTILDNVDGSGSLYQVRLCPTHAGPVIDEMNVRAATGYTKQERDR